MTNKQSKVNLGEQVTIVGDTDLVDIIKTAYDRIVEAQLDLILKEQLQTLAVAIGRLSERLPRSQSIYMAYHFQALLNEILAEPPQPLAWQVYTNLIRKAAESQPNFAQPVHVMLDQLIPNLDKWFGPHGDVQLREITGETVRLICLLSETLSDPQKGFVAPNAISIAQAHFTPTAWFRAVYAGEMPVGFLMLNDKPDEPEYFLWRFMIAEPYHGRGYGRQAIERLIDYVRTRPGAKELLVSCGQGAGSPQGFYQRLGFEPTGEILGSEVVLRLAL